MRLIDADKLHTLFDNNCVGDCNVCNFYTSVHYVIHNKDCKGHSYCGLIDNTPTVEERPRGKWIRHDFITCLGLGDWTYKCSVCNKVSNENYKFCPNCGAKMRGVGR